MSEGPVLVVDDDTVSRHVLGQALASADLPYVAVGSGTEALAADRADPAVDRPARSRDAAAGRLPGPAHLRARARRRATCPSSCSPALDADSEIARAFEAGADDFVRKPFQAGRARRAHPRAAASSRGDGRARAQRARRAGRPRAHAGARVEPRFPRHPLHGRPAHRRGRAGRSRVDRPRARRRRRRLRRRRERRRAAPRPADRAREVPRDPAGALDGEALVIRDAATHPLLEIVRHDTQAQGVSARSRSCRSSTRGGRWASSSCARSRRVPFGERELALCSTVSNAMAIALRNARVLQSLRDQTQQVTVARFEAERRMRSLQRYADFFESAADGIVVIDARAGSSSRTRRRARSPATTRTISAVASSASSSSTKTCARVRELRVGFAKGRYPAATSTCA